MRIKAGAVQTIETMVVRWRVRRVPDAPVAAPEPVLPPLMTATEARRYRTSISAWNLDLGRLRTGEMSFEAFARRHVGIVRRLCARWSRRCPERLGIDDATQEALLEIWRAVDLWDPLRGVPLHAFVRGRVRFRLLGMTDRLLKGRDIETRYLWATGRRDDTVSDRSQLVDDEVAAGRRFARVIGSVDHDAAEIIMGVVSGEHLDVLSREVYARRTEAGGAKKARSVIRQAVHMASLF